MFYNVVQCLNFTFQTMLGIDKSALLYKLTFIIKNHEMAIVETTNKLFV